MSRSVTKPGNKSKKGQKALPPAGDICFYFRVLHENYTDCLKVYLRKHGLKSVQPGFGFVLFQLFEHGTLRPSDICRDMGVKPPTLTAITDQMVKAKLIKRRADENDRRATLLSLSRKGESLRDECFHLVAELTETICQGISKKNLGIAMKAMRQMMVNMSSAELS